MVESEACFSFFEAEMSEWSDEIFSEDPAVLASQLIRPSRPGYSVDFCERKPGNCTTRHPFAFGAVLGESISLETPISLVF